MTSVPHPCRGDGRMPFTGLLGDGALMCAKHLELYLAPGKCHVSVRKYDHCCLLFTVLQGGFEAVGCRAGRRVVLPGRGAWRGESWEAGPGPCPSLRPASSLPLHQGLQDEPMGANPPQLYRHQVKGSRSRFPPRALIFSKSRALVVPADIP